MGGMEKEVKEVGSFALNPFAYASEKLAKEIGKETDKATGITATKEAAEMQKSQIMEQKSIVAEQEAELKQQETKRKMRISRKRQGRRALLFSDGNELGVSTKLGG